MGYCWNRPDESLLIAGVEPFADYVWHFIIDSKVVRGHKNSDEVPNLYQSGLQECVFEKPTVFFTFFFPDK